MKLSKIQEKAINKIIDYYTGKNNPDQYGNFQPENIIEFKAPTGSGKTFMAANLISKIFALNSIRGKKTVVLIATLSSSDLPKQMEQNLNSYKQFLAADGNFEVEYKESPSKSNSQKSTAVDKNYYLIPKDKKVFIVGKSSFGKNRIFTEQRVFENFVDRAKNENFEFIYIRDEAHWGNRKEALNKDESKFENYIQDNATFTLYMTATPNSNNKKVIIEEKDLEKDNIRLVKNSPNFNLKLNETKLDLIDDEEVLKTAIKEFKEIKKNYNSLKTNINPAMLIQVSNSDNIDKEKQNNFEENIKKIIEILNANNLTWVKYFGSNNIEDSGLRYKCNNLMSISENDSSVDVIIFKIGPAVGWNIPRACMLVSLRNVFSEALNQQTLGRIKRFAVPDISNDEKDEIEILNNYYVYSNYQEKTRTSFQYSLKEEYKKEKFFKGEITNKNNNKVIDKFKEYKNDVVELLKEKTKEINEKIQDTLKKYNEQNCKIESFDIQIWTDNNYKKQYDLNPLKNLVILALSVNRELINKKNFIDNDLKNKIEKEVFSENKLLNKYSFYLIWYVILKHYFEDIKNKYETGYEEFKKDNFCYEIKEGDGLLEFIQFWEYKNKTNVLELAKRNEKVFDSFVYKQIIDSKENDNKQKIILDSKAELSFLQKMVEYIFEKNNINKANESDEKNNAECWIRNTRLGSKGIYFEYYDEDSKEIRKSFPDFIIKFNNNSYHIFEIKNVDDFNKDKTEKILESYKKYNEVVHFNLKNKKSLLNDISQKPLEFSLYILNINNDNWDKSFVNNDERDKLVEFIEKKYNTK